MQVTSFRAYSSDAVRTTAAFPALTYFIVTLQRKHRTMNPPVAPVILIVVVVFMALVDSRPSSEEQRPSSSMLNDLEVSSNSGHQSFEHFQIKQIFKMSKEQYRLIIREMLKLHEEQRKLDDLTAVQRRRPIKYRQRF